MSFNIWRIIDGKAGHDSQSLGLCNAIAKNRSCQRFDIPITLCKQNVLNLLFNRFPAGLSLSDPNLVIGAGHTTHLPMLAAKQARGGKIIVLMKPSLPYSWFDYCLIPQHDNVKSAQNIISTFGTINTIEPNLNKDNKQVLILIGGSSRHFDWHNKNIVNQIVELLVYYKDKSCLIVGSRRTPSDFYTYIKKTNANNVFSEKELDRTSLHQLIGSSGSIWVTKDSVSMIYESLSAGAAVGLLNVAAKKKNKINNTLDVLENKGYLTSFDSWKKTRQLKSAHTFNEAKRCTEILAQKGALN